MKKVLSAACLGGRKVGWATPDGSLKTLVMKSLWEHWTVLWNIQIRNASRTINIISALI